jgi:hypothetical protein
VTLLRTGRFGFRFLVVEIYVSVFQKFLLALGPTQASVQWAPRSLPEVKRRGVRLTIDANLLHRFGISGAIPHFLYAFTTRVGYTDMFLMLIKLKPVTERYKTGGLLVSGNNKVYKMCKLIEQVCLQSQSITFINLCYICFGQCWNYEGEKGSFKVITWGSRTALIMNSGVIYAICLSVCNKVSSGPVRNQI